MNRNIKHLSWNLILFIFFIGMSSCTDKNNEVFSETVKVSLREVGHQLLLTNNDTTSLVAPIIALPKSKYQLSFEKELFIHPDTLVTSIKKSFQKANLPSHYLTEVVRCSDHEVAYSYEMKQDVEKGIIPCGGRQLHKGCYKITVRFTKVQETQSDSSWLLYIAIFGAIAILVWMFFMKKRKMSLETEKATHTSIGSYKFYPEQNKLIKEATEISLSKKECELLAIFVAQPNQVIKRDLLTKKVWEDNGVVVGRSLDTYISKLRKKLKDDNTIKLTNVHGVGYKLEV